MIDLRNNLLITLPDSFVLLLQLKSLDLKANTLEKLPSGFDQLSGLKNLNISFNESLDLLSAAKQLQHMKQLEVLDISYNKLNAPLYEALKKALPTTKIIAKGFNNLEPIEGK
ncbi:MAG: hypothetical protein ABI729_01725 [Chitinophagales bacterium]